MASREKPYKTLVDSPKALEEAREERLSLAVDAAEVGTFYCPIPLGEIVWNPKCKEHFWLPIDAEIDFDLFYSRLHPDDRERTREAVEAAVFSGIPYDIEYRTLSPWGEVRWLRAKGSTYYNDQGEASRFDGITIDISHQKRLEGERDHLLERERLQRQQAQQANNLKDTIIATVSHELRAPLAAILAWVDLLDRRTGDQEFVKTGISVIRRNVMSQTQLVGDLLDLNRISSGKVALNAKLVLLAEQVDAEVREIAPLAERKGVTIRAEMQHGLAVSGDASRLRQIFANILSNALKYTPTGGHIAVIVANNGSMATVRVSDSGEGIPSHLLAQIFEPFSQVDGSTTRTHGGLGLGLSIAKSLAAMHDGRLVATSPGVGQGSTFTLSIPLAAVASTDAKVDISLPRETYALLAGKSVLLVDDDIDTLDVFRLIFEEQGVSVHTASSPALAREILCHQRIHAIFSDIGMPGEDGYQFISSLRQSGDITPAVAVSAFVREEDRERAHDAGFDRHIGKPAEPSRLLGTLFDLVKRNV